MGKSRRQRVWERAGSCCEYCRMPEAYDVRPLQLDHIRAQKHAGATTLANLALACLACNVCKGPNVAGYDPESNTLQPLFNPRRDVWDEHFWWDGPRLVGKTPIGRASMAVLRINEPDRVEHRRLLMQVGVFPPAAGAETVH